MNASDIYNMGIEKFNSLFDGLNKDGCIINIDCTLRDYCRVLTQLYAEADGEYYKCAGTDIFKDTSRINYYGICMEQGKNKNGIKQYKTLPGAISLQKNISTTYKIRFKDSVAHLLKGGEYDNAKPKTVTVKSFTGNIANKEYMSRIPHSAKKKSPTDFVEWARNAQLAKEADHSFNSDISDQAKQALLADGLSEDGFNIILDKLMKNLIQDNSPLMTKLVDKTIDAQYKRNLKYKFKPYSTEEIKNQTFNIYNENLINEALKILGEDHKLLIVGESGSGKSRLATLLAQQLTGKIIDSESVDGRYQHIWIKNVDGEMLWYTGQDSTLFGNLNIFINHINNEVKENPSNVNQKYVFILNEIQRTDLGAISGNLFESWSSGVMPDDIPKNLYIICTACSNSDFELDEQIFQRFGHIELNYLRKENPDMIFRLCKAIAENPIFESRFEECSDIISKCQELNDMEDYQVINMRHLFAMLNNRVIKNPINKEDLTSPGKKKLQEMINKGYYKT